MFALKAVRACWRSPKRKIDEGAADFREGRRQKKKNEERDGIGLGMTGKQTRRIQSVEFIARSVGFVYEEDNKIHALHLNRQSLT